MNQPKRELVERSLAVRRFYFVGSVVLIVVAIISPMWGWAHHLEYVQGIQFCVLAVVSPLLAVRSGALTRFMRRRQSPSWDFFYFALYAAVLVLWRTPFFVNHLVHSPWLTVAESLVLLCAGVRAWSSLVPTPETRATLSHLQRLICATVLMWTIWVTAYLVGLSQSSWYRAYDHGGWLSVSTDQQITAGLLWAISGAAFTPFVFWNLYRWLRSEETSSDELAQRILLARQASAAP